MIQWLLISLIDRYEETKNPYTVSYMSLNRYNLITSRFFIFVKNSRDKLLAWKQHLNRVVEFKRITGSSGTTDIPLLAVWGTSATPR